MSKGVSDKITYKPYDQGQAYLIPPSVEELIPVNHLVRLVSEVIDEMGITGLLGKYRAGRRGKPVPSPDDDHAVCIRIPNQSLFIPDVSERGEGEGAVHVAGLRAET